MCEESEQTELESVTPPSDVELAVGNLRIAIMRGQARALQAANAEQLSLYFSIGKYISSHTRGAHQWGRGALSAISELLRRQMPGLRGFSESNLKFMRVFYEQWHLLDPASGIVQSPLEQRNSMAPDDNRLLNSAVATSEFNVELSTPITIEQVEDIVLSRSAVPDDFPKEEFLKVPFTQHMDILNHVKGLDARYFYLRLCVSERLTVKGLSSAISREEHKHRGALVNNFSRAIPDAERARQAVMAFKDAVQGIRV